jgi:tetratricopeptide (TPR) repeat protein
VAAAVCLVLPVRAEDADKAREHYSIGLRAFELGRYVEAIAEFEQAYQLKDAPGLLYNIGQAYRLSNRPEEALRYYRTYLERKPDAANRDEVQTKIHRLVALLEERKVPAADTPEAVAAVAKVAAVPRPPSLAVAPLPPSPSAAPAEAVAARTPDRFWTARKAGWIATGIGAAAFVFAVYFGLEARSAAAAVESDAAAGRPFNPALDAKGHSSQTLSRILLASAAAGFGAGGLLFQSAGSTPIEKAAPAGEAR